MNVLLKQRDTLPALEAQLFYADGTVINLDMCAVTFYAYSPSTGNSITKVAEIVDKEEGKIVVEWVEEETKQLGTYECEFKIVFTDNKVMTVPNDGYFIIRITEGVMKWPTTR